MTNDRPNMNHVDIKRKHRKMLQQSTFISLLGITILGAISYYIITQNRTAPEQILLAELRQQTTAAVKLMAFRNTPTGEQIEWTVAPKFSDIIGFKLASHLPIYIAIAGSINAQPPIILFGGVRIPPGPNSLVERAGSKLTYTVKPTDNTLKFCLLYGESREQLLQQVHQLNTLWSSLSTSACLQLL